jgi:hypothetical protein
LSSAQKESPNINEFETAGTPPTSTTPNKNYLFGSFNPQSSHKHHSQSMVSTQKNKSKGEKGPLYYLHHLC